MPPQADQGDRPFYKLLKLIEKLYCTFDNLQVQDRTLDN